MSMHHKCSKNPKKITASYLYYRKVTVIFSGHLHMQIVSYKNNKVTKTIKA